MICFDGIVRVLLHDMRRIWQQLIDHSRIGRARSVVTSVGRGRCSSARVKNRRVACTVPKLDAGLVVRCFSAELSSSSVLVDHSAEDAMMPDRGVEQSHRGGVVQWWALVEALVRAVVIEMAHILVEDGKGVSLVINQ